MSDPDIRPAQQRPLRPKPISDPAITQLLAALDGLQAEIVRLRTELERMGLRDDHPEQPSSLGFPRHGQPHQEPPYRGPAGTW